MALLLIPRNLVRKYEEKAPRGESLKPMEGHR